MEFYCRASTAKILSRCNVRASQVKKTPRGPRLALNRRRPAKQPPDVNLSEYKAAPGLAHKLKVAVQRTATFIPSFLAKFERSTG